MSTAFCRSFVSNFFAWPLMLLVLAGCAVGPDYQRPEMELPASFAGHPDWKVAEPGDTETKGHWWEVFNDTELSRLEEQATLSSPQVAVALARLDQATAVARIDRAALLPNLAVNGSTTRSRTARDLSSTGAAAYGNLYSLPLDLGYEIDLWGRVRRSVEAAGASAEKSAADYAGVLLSLQAEVARNYFALRTLDNEIALLEQNVTLRRESLRMVQSRFDLGATDRLELTRAETELAITEAEAIGLKRTRGELEHALAALLGEMPGRFALPVATAPLTTPEIPSGVPSQLLERRPDIAAAERAMAAANARIGIAKAAFFPTVSLFGSAGYASTTLEDLSVWDNRTWAIGPSIHLPIFEGGRNFANLARSKAAYAEQVASYRQQVLLAVREVEDGLLALEILTEQQQVQQRGVEFAAQAVSLSEKRYQVGTVGYQEVLDTQRIALQAQRSAVNLKGQNLQAAISLVKALGGDWRSGS